MSKYRLLNINKLTFFRGQIDTLLFIGFSGFSINKIPCLLFLVDGDKGEYSTVLKYLKHI